MSRISLQEFQSQETKRDLHVFYTQLRSMEPLHYVEDLNFWLTTTYEDALFVLKDPRFTKDRRKISTQQHEQDPLIASIFQNMLTVDPPDHSRLRRLVSKAFTPRMIEQLRPRIQQITDELLDAVQERGSMDVITEFAYPLPITVISEMLGIPVSDRASFRTWTQAIVNQREDTRTALEAFLHYIQSLLAAKRAHPGNDLVSRLVQVRENEDQLSEAELVSMVFLLIVAGHETTVNLLGNGTLALLQHPDQMNLLRADPSLLPAAVEELLRYTAPVSLSDERWASEDIPLHGKVIRKGEQVMAALISANADTQQFSDPTELDITRQENQHLAFGKGIHYCLGAPLARLEGQIAFGTLLQRLPDLRLAIQPNQLTWNNNPMLHGLTSLPVVFQTSDQVYSTQDAPA
ncbi:polyketide biosynthesis cytochrome P450 PksS [Ktedonobacter sp. SOSP1-85]|uniref:cytochrome P450 family protein n=1 Tax=Ktedonobacter sp. SOSP1-85 TaxID=2778367 RepID=UPI0019166647|nr:cytochrome P450 [Ktedonobacter sp. SOSP1-85]GHO72678.1 polyketide biosynthesis cytochrome P450 PksS [Ktedonobacter sp. SOSP1-85]